MNYSDRGYYPFQARVRESLVGGRAVPPPGLGVPAGLRSAARAGAAEAPFCLAAWSPAWQSWVAGPVGSMSGRAWRARVSASWSWPSHASDFALTPRQMTWVM